MHAATALAEAPAPPVRHLSVSEAATYLGLSVAYLNRLRTIGGGPPFFNIGARVVYSPTDLDAWLSPRRRTSTADDGKGAGK